MPSDKSSKLCTEIVLPKYTASSVSSGERARLAGEAACQEHLQMLLGAFAVEYLPTQHCECAQHSAFIAVL